MAIRAPLLAFLAGLALVGCAGGAREPAPVVAPAARPAAEAPAAVAPVPPVAALPPVAGAAARYVGLKPAELQAQLGEASFVRRDRGAEIWQYRGTGCVLHLFLYADNRDGLRVSFAEVRDGAGRLVTETAIERACVDEAMVRRRVG